MKKSFALKSLIVAGLLTMAQASFATTVTAVGPLSSTPTTPSPMLQIGNIFLPDAFSFNLTSASNVTVDMTSFSLIPSGTSFSLFSSSNLSNALSSISLPSFTPGFSTSFGFNGLSAGDYLLKFNPQGAAGIYTSTLTFSSFALPPVSSVPEADTSALMLSGLGLMAFAVRRKSKLIAK